MAYVNMDTAVLGGPWSGAYVNMDTAVLGGSWTGAYVNMDTAVLGGSRSTGRFLSIPKIISLC